MSELQQNPSREKSIRPFCRSDSALLNLSIGPLYFLIPAAPASLRVGDTSYCKDLVDINNDWLHMTSHNNSW